MSVREIGIYSITSPSGKVYVGMTCDSFESRWDGHKKKLRANNHHCRGLQRAYHKYGEGVLVFFILEKWVISDKSDLKKLNREINQAEVKWWKAFKAQGICLYNGEPTGTGGVLHTSETRKILAQRVNERTKIERALRPLKPKKCTQCGKEFHPERRVLVVCSEECKEKSKLRTASRVLFTKELLEELYVEQKMSTAQIAQKFDCSQPAILYQLNKFAIPRRSNSAVGYRLKEIVDK